MIPSRSSSRSSAAAKGLSSVSARTRSQSTCSRRDRATARCGAEVARVLVHRVELGDDHVGGRQHRHPHRQDLELVGPLQHRRGRPALPESRKRMSTIASSVNTLNSQSSGGCTTRRSAARPARPRPRRRRPRRSRSPRRAPARVRRGPTPRSHRPARTARRTPSAPRQSASGPPAARRGCSSLMSPDLPGTAAAMRVRPSRPDAAVRACAPGRGPAPGRADWPGATGHLQHPARALPAATTGSTWTASPRPCASSTPTSSRCRRSTATRSAPPTPT